MERIRVLKPFGGVYRISSPYGERIDPITKEKKAHRGVDFACPVGTPIRAVLDGKVIVDGWEVSQEIDPEGYKKKGYGLRVWQECHYRNEVILIVYAHLSEIRKHRGEFVSASGIIGLSGNTGKSTGPHLHIGARIKDTSHFLDFEWEGDEVEAGEKEVKKKCLIHVESTTAKRGESTVRWSSLLKHLTSRISLSVTDGVRKLIESLRRLLIF